MSRRNRRKCAKEDDSSPPLVDKRFETVCRRQGVPQLAVSMIAAANESSEIVTKLVASRDFKLLMPGQPGMSAGTLASPAFWFEVHSLLVLARKTAAVAQARLINALSGSIAMKSTIATAFLTRAFIEHTAALCGVSRTLLAHDPAITPALLAACSYVPSAQSEHLHKSLAKYAIGARIELPTKPMPPLVAPLAEWEAFRTGLAVESPIATTSATTDIKKLSERPAMGWVPTYYDLLCEFCHPNSVQRLDDMSRVVRVARSISIEEREIGSAMNRFTYVLRMAATIVQPLCAATAESQRILEGACMPTRPSVSPIQGVPPIGSFAARGLHGELRYVSEINIDRSGPKVPLTPEQRERAARVLHVFRDFHSCSLDDWIRDFEIDTVYAEDEIRAYECMATVYRDELVHRQPCPRSELRLLYMAILRSIEFKSLDGLLSACPELKRLPDLERVYGAMDGLYQPLACRPARTEL